MRGGRVASVVAVVGAVVALAAGPSLASALEWNIARVGAPTSGAGGVIAVIDTGVDDAHPALAGRVLPAVDLVGGGGDDNGHGTHVAGIAAGADRDPGCGAIGVAPDARVLPVKALDDDGAGSVEDVAEGIRRAADRGATVINLSLGADVVLRTVSGSGLEDAIGYAWSKGAIPVLAAGNDGLLGGVVGSGYRDLPAVVVTATDHRDRVAPYATSIGSARWGVAAPGGDGSGERGRDILSAFPDRRCALHAGTSMAAPHVSGALAVLRARGLQPREAVEHLVATARDLGPAGPDATYGHGLVDLAAALDALPTRVPGAPEPTRAPPATAATDAPRPAESPAPPVSAAPVGDGADAPLAPDTTDAPDPDPAAPPSAPPTSSGSRPPTGAGDGGGGGAGAASAVVADATPEDGIPGALVTVAVVALGSAATGTGVAARTLRRHP